VILRHTIRQWRAQFPRITPVLLAESINSMQARELIRCAYELSKADPDDEAGYCAAADRFERAESVFLAVHADTEVAL
jgi:hypothetical protein